MNRPARLIVNADDFGLHKSINAAVVSGHLGGIITSCSLIPPKHDSDLHGREPFADALARIGDAPSLDIGLHFALVGRQGEPRGYAKFLAQYIAGRYPPSRIEQLLNRQLDQLERAGINASHIDSHQHLHALPGVMRVVCDVAAKRGVRGIRLPRDREPICASSTRISSCRALGLLAAVSGKLIDRAGLWRPDHFIGMAASGHLTPDILLTLIDRLPARGVVELICHPGADNRELAQDFDWGYDWQAELASVTSPVVIDRLRTTGIELTTFMREPRKMWS